MIVRFYKPLRRVIALIAIPALSLSGAAPIGANLHRIPGSAVFLTFDAHPCKDTMLHKCEDLPAIDGAWKLLDTLRANGIRSTFFFTGQFIEKYPDIVRRALQDGHEIGSHLNSHTHPLEFQEKHITLNKTWFMNELLSADRALVKTGNGHAVKFFRMPYGLASYSVLPGARRNILQWAQEAGYTHVDWSVDTLDWISRDARSHGSFLPPYLTSRQMEDRVIADRGGAIVLSHLTRYRPFGEPSVNEMIPDLLVRLKKQNLRTARISDGLGVVPPAELAVVKEESVREVQKETPVAAVNKCNYSWDFKRVHICITGMTESDCAGLEESFLSREEECICTKPGVKYNLQNLGELVQISCKL